jgi:hypothetical protein
MRYTVKTFKLGLEVADPGDRTAGSDNEIIAASVGRPAGDGRAWPSLLRMLDREAPSCRDLAEEPACD